MAEEKIQRKTELIENPELNSYIKEFNDDVTITLANLREKSLMMSSIKAKWLSYYMKEKENMTRLQNLKTKILKEKTENSNSSVLRLKSEESISQNDEKIKKINELMTKTKENIDYIERGMNILSDLVWQIKNTLQIVQLEQS